MSELFTFEFTGGLADSHMMNFYEAARFQYAAARFLVKLDQFRRSGRFASKVTDKGNVGITLESQQDGSFRINVSAPEEGSSAADNYLDVSLGDLIAYVADRVIETIDSNEVAELFNSNNELIGIYGKVNPDDGRKIQAIVRDLIENSGMRHSLFVDGTDALERRISEVGRQQRLVRSRDTMKKIDRSREQKLIAMAAPLIKEMATALRRSADELRIKSSENGSSENVLYLNQAMARKIESTKIDETITPILGNIIQYNKETGWGKIRLSLSPQPLSFNTPSDIKYDLQERLLFEMGRDQVYVQLYLVRNRAAEPVRAILVGILELPD